jgi:hypothetical protein
MYIKIFLLLILTLILYFNTEKFTDLPNFKIGTIVKDSEYKDWNYPLLIINGSSYVPYFKNDKQVWLPNDKINDSKFNNTKFSSVPVKFYNPQLEYWSEGKINLLVESKINPNSEIYGQFIEKIVS